MKINLDEIRRFIPHHIFTRGITYYRQNRVNLLQVEKDFFSAAVAGTRNYIVEIRAKKNGGFYGDCSCPYYDDCKHMVAAMIKAKNVYEHMDDGASEIKPSPNWQIYIDDISKDDSTEKPKWQLIYTIQLQANNWRLVAQKLNLKKDGTLGASQTMTANDFSNPKIARRHEDSLVLSFLEKKQSYNSYNSLYYIPVLDGFQYGEDIGIIFNSMRGGLVYLKEIGDTKGERGDPLNFATEKGKIEFRMSEDDESNVCPFLIHNNKAIELGHSFHILSSKPVWILKDNLLIEIANIKKANSLLPFTRKNYKMIVPKKELPKFLAAISRQTDLFENIHLPDNAKTETVRQFHEKRLYLSEFDNDILIKPKFCYGDVIVDFNETQSDFWGNATEKDLFVKVLRDHEREAEVLEVLLNSPVKTKDDRITTCKNDALNWMMTEVPKLIKAGFVIYGEKDLKQFKVNRSTAKIHVNVSSGIDWFDLNMEIDFGGILLSLKDLKKAIHKKSKYVKLSDGSSALLPQEWLERLKHALNFSEEKEGKLQLSHFHATLIDELFAEVQSKNFDDGYHQKLKQLKNFNGIKNKTIPKNLKGTLRPYQSEGYNWLHFLREFQFGGCLADDMGLGKTIQALALLLSVHKNGEKNPSLIIAPTSVIFNWVNEIERFAPKLKVYTQTGNERARTAKDYKNYDIILTSYGTIRRDVFFLKDVQFNYVILDESQYIKNPLSQTAKAVKLLKAQHRLALTGTPVENNTTELWSLFSFLNPGLLGNLNYFKNAFAKPIEKEQDEDAADLLRKMVFPFILRRTKEKVAKDLPPKVESVIYCEMAPKQRKLYNQWRDYYRAALLKKIADSGLNKSRMNVLEGLTKLRQIACHPLLVEDKYLGGVGKYDTVLEHIEEILSEGHKILVFSQFVRMLTILRKHFDSTKIPYEYLDGKTRDRKSCVERFQNDETCKLFFISLKAGGLGLNLTAADYVIHYDPWWNPAVEAQATDRSHRIGQDKHVFVYKMITKDSVEEKILELQKRKKDLVENIISTEAGVFKRLTVNDIESLFS